MSKTSFAMFLAGATVGAAATWLCLKRYYEQIAQEEIDSVKAAFRGGHGRRLYCRLTSFSRSLQINLRINVDGTVCAADGVEIDSWMTTLKTQTGGIIPSGFLIIPCPQKNHMHFLC